MKPFPIVLSLALHAAIVGAVWVGSAKVSDKVPAETAPITFELIEEEETPPPPPPVDTPIVDAPLPPLPPSPQPHQAITPPPATDAPSTPNDVQPPPPPPPPPPPQQQQQHPSPRHVERAKVVSAPQALNRLTPIYPRRARRNGREGRVVVEATIMRSGEVANVAVVSTSGDRDLDRAAANAMSEATFAPAREDGVAVDGKIRLTFDFRLDSH